MIHQISPDAPDSISTSIDETYDETPIKHVARNPRWTPRRDAHLTKIEKEIFGCSDDDDETPKLPNTAIDKNLPNKAIVKNRPARDRDIWIVKKVAVLVDPTHVLLAEARDEKFLH
jgi:hypothetical protein